MSPTPQHQPGAPRDMAAALRASEARFRRVFEAVPVGMALVDGDARFVDVNEALAAMLEHERADLIGRTFVDVTPEEDARRDVELIGRMFAGVINRFHLEKRYVTRRGRVKWGAVQAACIDPDPADATADTAADADDAIETGGERYAVVIIEDITARKEADARLAHLATHDELTGLPNRAMAMEGLNHALARTERTGEQLAVLYVDLDGLKALNARLGHETGDVVLVETAGRVQSVLRRADTAARMGSDELVVWCEDLGPDIGPARDLAMAIAERICDAVAGPIALPDRDLEVTASVGVVVTSGRDRPLATLLREAATAVATAKAGGGGRAALSGEPLEIDLRDSEVPPGNARLYG